MAVKNKILALLLIIITGFIALLSCANDNTIDNTESKIAHDKAGYLNKTGFPIVNEPINLRAMVMRYDSQPDYASIEVWKEYEKMTGIHVEWIQVPRTDVEEKRNVALAAKDLPDFFMRCSIPDKDLLSYGEQGVFIRLNELIDNYGPNIQEIFRKYPDVKKGLTMHNGSIYSMPSITEQLSNSVDKKMFVNTKWLEKTGMAMPETTDELYMVLKAFKEGDPNGNGIADEIPLTAGTLESIIDGLKGAWGLGNRGRTQNKFDLDPETGRVRFICADPRFREVLEYLHKLYSEGLLDKEIFATSNTQMNAKASSNTVGVFLNISSAAAGKYEEDYAGIPKALKGPYGDQLWSPVKARLMGKGQFAITSANRYPEATMRWIDYFQGDDGIRMFYMGIEGITYIKTPQGTYQWTDKILEGFANNDNTFFNKHIPYPGGNNPSPVRDPYFGGATAMPIPTKAAKDMEPYFPEERWPTFNFTTEENEKIIVLERNILGYVEAQIKEFIVRGVTMDQWEEYLAALEDMGLSEYKSIYQAAYERYIKD